MNSTTIQVKTTPKNMRRMGFGTHSKRCVLVRCMGYRHPTSLRGADGECQRLVTDYHRIIDPETGVAWPLRGIQLIKGSTAHQRPPYADEKEVYARMMAQAAARADARMRNRKEEDRDEETPAPKKKKGKGKKS